MGTRLWLAELNTKSMVHDTHINISFDNLILIRFRNGLAGNCGSGFPFSHCEGGSRESMVTQNSLLEKRQWSDFVDAC